MSPAGFEGNKLYEQSIRLLTDPLVKYTGLFFYFPILKFQDRFRNTLFHYLRNDAHFI